MAYQITTTGEHITDAELHRRFRSGVWKPATDTTETVDFAGWPVTDRSQDTPRRLRVVEAGDEPGEPNAPPDDTQGAEASERDDKAVRADGGTPEGLPPIRGADGMAAVEANDGEIDLLRIDGSPEGIRNIREHIPALADATDDEIRETFDRYREWRKENPDIGEKGLTQAVVRGFADIDADDEQTETTDHDDKEKTMQTTDFSDESEDLAEAVLTADDIREQREKNLTAAEYLSGKYRLDASEYDDRYQLRRHLTDAKNDIPVAEQTVDAKPTADEHLADFAEQQETGSATGDPTAADHLAKDHMIISELRGAVDAGRSPAEHLAAEYDIDTAEYVEADHGDDDTEGLREALADARARVDMTGLPGDRDGRGGRQTTDMSSENGSEPLSPSNPGGVGEPHGQKGPTNPRNPHVSPSRFGEHASNTDGEGE